MMNFDPVFSECNLHPDEKIDFPFRFFEVSFMKVNDIGSYGSLILPTSSPIGTHALECSHICSLHAHIHKNERTQSDTQTLSIAESTYLVSHRHSRLRNLYSQLGRNFQRGTIERERGREKKIWRESFSYSSPYWNCRTTFFSSALEVFFSKFSTVNSRIFFWRKNDINSANDPHLIIKLFIKTSYKDESQHALHKQMNWW